MLGIVKCPYCGNRDVDCFVGDNEHQIAFHPESPDDVSVDLVCPDCSLSVDGTIIFLPPDLPRKYISRIQVEYDENRGVPLSFSTEEMKPGEKVEVINTNAFVRLCGRHLPAEVTVYSKPFGLYLVEICDGECMIEAQPHLEADGSKNWSTPEWYLIGTVPKHIETGWEEKESLPKTELVEKGEGEQFFAGIQKLREGWGAKDPLFLKGEEADRRLTELRKLIASWRGTTFVPPFGRSRVRTTQEKIQQPTNYNFLAFYILSNLEPRLRYFVFLMLYSMYSERYGKKKWWDAIIPSDIVTQVEKAREHDQQNPLSIKKDNIHPICYATFAHLRVIIEKRWDDFKEVFHHKHVILGDLEKLEYFRNTIAHNRPMKEKEYHLFREITSRILGIISELKKN